MSLLTGRRPAPVTARPVDPDGGWSGWVRLGVATAARTMLAALGGLLIWALLPAMIGWHSTSVMTGSMEPRLMIGDAAVSRPVQTADLRVGQVLLFDDPDHPGRLRMHRMVGINDDGLLITRGDANRQDDSSPVRRAAVRGVGTLRIPLIGLPRVWVGDRNLIAIGVSVAALMLLIAAAGLDRRLRRESRDEDERDNDRDRDDGEADDDHGRSAGPTGPRHAVDRPEPALVAQLGDTSRRLLTGLLAGAAALMILVGGHNKYDASAAFAATAHNGLNNLTAAYYRCTSAIAANSPDLWYKFDETSGTTANDSAGTRPGSYSGLAGVTLGAAAACKSDTGSAITLNGLTGMVTSNQSLNIGLSGTLEMWFKVSPGLTGGELMGFGDRSGTTSSNVDRLLYISGTGKITFGVTVGTTKKTITSSGSYSDGTWHHLAGTFSGAGIVLYVDGHQVAVDGSAVVTKPLNTYFVHVGCDAIGAWNGLLGGNYVAGSFDNVAVYSTALTAAQVAAHAGAA